jgi:hypothetical protein
LKEEETALAQNQKPIVVGVRIQHRKNGKIDRSCKKCIAMSALKKRFSPETREAYLKYQREYQREYYRKNK